MALSEEILNQACDKLRSGASIRDVLLDFPDQAKELEPLLETLSLLVSLPKNISPEPAMQRKYILAPARRLWLGWLPFSRLATISTSVMLLATVFLGTGYAANQSLPGDRLFQLKKTSEQLRMKMTTSPEGKISLQVEINKKRLTEAETVLKDPERDAKSEKAALTELASATRHTIEAVDKAAKESHSLAKKQDTTIVASLENITAQQQELLKQLSPQHETDSEAQIALETSQENIAKIAEIKKYIEAAGNEQSLATLEQNPATLTATGTISRVSKNSITVENTTFAIDGKTIIKNEFNDTVKVGELQLKAKATVIGDRIGDTLLATQIKIVKNADTPESEAPSTTKPSLKRLPPNKEIVETPPANTAIGGFIPEDPAPQTKY